jgi:hypothetical protein
MNWTTDMMQRAAVMPNAALVGPAMCDPQLGNGWADGFATPWERIPSTHGFTAKRSARHLGRSST